MAARFFALLFLDYSDNTKANAQEVLVFEEVCVCVGGGGGGRALFALCAGLCPVVCGAPDYGRYFTITGSNTKC